MSTGHELVAPGVGQLRVELGPGACSHARVFQHELTVELDLDVGSDFTVSQGSLGIRVMAGLLLEMVYNG